MIRDYIELAVSIAATVTALVGIVMYGGWAAIWALPVEKLLNVLTEGFKRLYWKVVDVPRIKASKAGKPYQTAFWVALPWCLDWFFSASVVGTSVYWIIRTFVPEMPAYFAVAGVVAAEYSISSMVVILKGMEFRDEYADYVVRDFELGFCALVFVLAIFVDVTPLMFFGLSLCALVLEVVAYSILHFEGERKTYREIRDGLRNDEPKDYGQLGKWLPRPGVIFEMAPRSRSVAYFKEDMIPSLTVYRIQSLNFILSSLLLVAGFCGLVYLHHPLLLLMVFLIVLAKFVLPAHSRRYSECSYGYRCADIALPVYTVILIAGGIALMYPDMPTRLAAIAYLTGLMLSPISFMVRGTTANEPDVFCPWIALLGIAVAVSAFDNGIITIRGFFAPWACALFGTLVGSLYALIRGKFPPPDAVLPTKEPAGDDRRRKKRERQLANFRRSRGGK